MNFVFDKSCDKRKTLTLMSFFAFLFGAFAIMTFQMGIFFVPVISGLLAAVMVVEKDGKRIMTFVIPSVLIVLEFILCGIYSFNCAFSALLALIIYFAFNYKFFTKSECAFIATMLVAAYIGLLILLAAFYANGNFDLQQAKEYLFGIAEEAKNGFVQNMMENLNKMNSESIGGISASTITEEDVVAIYEGFERTLISIVLVISFMIAGIGFKVFQRNIFRCCDNKEEFVRWRFFVSGALTVTYLILFFASMFVSGKVDTASLVIDNFYNFLTYVYAYVGFGVARAYLDHRFGGKSIIFIVISFLILNVFVVNMLSAFGVLFSVLAIKFEKRMGNGDDSNNGVM